MKKSTILSLATASAIVATSAFTFAQWDQTSSSASTTLTLDKPVVMEMSLSELTATRTMGTDPVYTGTSTLNVKNLPDDVTVTNYEIVYKANVYEDANKTTPVSTDDITVVATEEAPAATLDGEHTVTVKVTPKETAKAKEYAENSTALTVEVTAELTPTSGN